MLDIIWLKDWRNRKFLSGGSWPELAFYLGKIWGAQIFILDVIPVSCLQFHVHRPLYQRMIWKDASPKAVLWIHGCHLSRNDFHFWGAPMHTPPSHSSKAATRDADLRCSVLDIWHTQSNLTRHTSQERVLVAPTDTKRKCLALVGVCLSILSSQNSKASKCRADRSSWETRSLPVFSPTPPPSCILTTLFTISILFFSFFKSYRYLVCLPWFKHFLQEDGKVFGFLNAHHMENKEKALRGLFHSNNGCSRRWKHVFCQHNQQQPLLWRPLECLKS